MALTVIYDSNMQSKNAQTNPHHEIQQAIASYFQPSGNTSKQESKKTIQ